MALGRHPGRLSERYNGSACTAYDIDIRQKECLASYEIQGQGIACRNYKGMYEMLLLVKAINVDRSLKLKSFMAPEVS